ncbi:MAG TPA: DUF5667 domain-containing protein, partial [candidate division Zixibacteria bacterium]|nr:DUF5667 domain-containing protein [candidate division Zixibacteria bacterium]
MRDIHKRYLMISAVILLGLTFTISTGMAQAEDKIKDIVDDIKPYDGSTGPGSALYGLKIAFENMGETFTFNETEKVKKQVEHAELRIAEAKAELKNNDSDAMNRALQRYREKILSVDDRVTGMRRNEPELPELLDVQERIIKHQLVLRNLSLSQPDNRGLETALNNSIRLEEKFELRTRVKLEREIGDDRMRVRVREIEMEEKEIETEIEDNSAKVKVKVKFIASGVNRSVIEKEIIEKIKLGKDDIAMLMKEAVVSGTPTATGTPGAAVTETPRPTVTGTPGAAVTGTPEATDTPEMERPEGELKVRVESGRAISEVEVEFRFVLNTANRDEIINGIEQRLSALR